MDHNPLTDRREGWKERDEREGGVIKRAVDGGEKRGGWGWRWREGKAEKGFV